MPNRPGGVLDRIHPTRLVVLAFGALITIGTALLLLPFAHAEGERTSLMNALFTATSAVCVTGLTVVDTATHWSPFGKVVIIVLIQIGGFGIMTLGSLFALVLSRQLGLRQRMFAHTERASMAFGDVGRVVRVVALTTVIVEATFGLFLGVRLWQATDLGFGRAMGHGLFHSVSAFNNAGFALYSDNLMQFVTDPWVSGAIALTVVIGGLGFPVILDLLDQRLAWRRWSLHSQITVAGTAGLLALGFALVLAMEWGNPGTLGPLDWPEKVLASSFHAVMPRTAGFNTLDMAAMNETTLLGTTGLMMVGAGSASTAGGIKITTFTMLAFVIWAEVRGTPDVVAFERRIPTTLQRQALSIALIAVGVIGTGTLVIMRLSQLPLADAMFEITSAFGTVGLSTGVTPLLDTPSQLLVIVVMFLGRVGPLTLGAAIVLRSRPLKYRYPEEGMLIG